MKIPASELLDYIHPEALSVFLRTPSGEPCQEVSIEDLATLAAIGYIEGIANARGKLRKIFLTVPPDVAFREMGETKNRVKDSLHCDANTTVQRSLPSLPRLHKRHHNTHCFAWRNRFQRHSLREIAGGFTPHPGLLTAGELIRNSGPICPPLAQRVA